MSKRTRFAAALAAVLTATLPVVGQEARVDPFTLKIRERAEYTDRYGDPSLGAVLRTDERYNKPSLFPGPRGWFYWNYLPSPNPYQNPNLWPDKRPAYFFGNLSLPPGSSLTIHGRFPYARYFKFNFYAFEHNTFVAMAGASLAGYDIEPDPGSGNPFRIGADRQVKNRNFTIRVLADDPPANPADRPQNAVYIGRDSKLITGGFRVYVSDKGYDGAGWGPDDVSSLDGPGITYECKLADGTALSAEDCMKQFGRPMGFAPPPLTADQWYAMVDSKKNDPSLNPASAPARPDSQFQIFFSMKQIPGAFMTPEQEAKLPIEKGQMEGGGDPTTAYMLIFLSGKLAPVYVFRAKMPTFPNTYDNAKTMTDGEVQYWSVVTVAAPPSGELWDGIFDMQVPLDKDGFYTIVVSRPEDRPKNATKENGVAWINWGPGEGVNDPRDRKDWGMLIMRFMVCNKDWKYSPEQADKMGMAAEVMGPYYPRGYYTTKEKFEAEGPKKYGEK